MGLSDGPSSLHVADDNTNLRGICEESIDGKSMLDNIINAMKTDHLMKILLPAAHCDESAKKKKKKKKNLTTVNDNSSNKTNDALNDCLYDPFKHQGEVCLYLAKSIDDNHSSSPILPPDVITFDGKKYNLSNAKEARLWYNCLRHNKTKRKIC